MSKKPCVVITRLSSLSDDVVTIGEMVVGNYRCFSVENPWLQNAPYHSCIPEGHYVMRLGRYNRGGYAAYELQDVEGRTLIKIHVANRAKDVLGCIGPGVAVGHFGSGEFGVTNSKTTFANFMSELGDAPLVDLIIKWR